MKKKKILIMIGKLLLTLILIGVFLLGIILFLHYVLNIKYSDLKNQEYVQTIIKNTGGYAIIVFILISFLQVTFIPLPGAVTILAGNYLFGFFPSLLCSYTGMLLGSLLAFLLGRKIGRPYVNWVVGDNLTMEKYLSRLQGKETVLLFFMFLLPLFPDDMLCSLAGITSLSWGKFIIMQIITRFTSILGTLLFMSGEFIPYNFWGISLIIVLCIIAIICFVVAYKKSDKINAFLDNLALKISNKFKK